MLAKGSAFFAMWNGMAPEHAAEFPLMHARDHIGEHMAYLGRDGIRWVRRFADGHGSLPPNFVFYGMPSLDPLVDPAFAQAHVVETPWFLSMRPHYRDRIAYHFRVLASAGGGTGGSVGTLLLDLAADARTPSAKLDDAIDAMTRVPAVTAAHLGLADWTVPHHVGRPLPPCPQGQEDTGVLVVESFDRFDLATSMQALVTMLRECGIARAVRGHAHYAFSYAMNHDDLDHLQHFRRHDALSAARIPR